VVVAALLFLLSSGPSYLYPLEDLHNFLRPFHEHLCPFCGVHCTVWGNCTNCPVLATSSIGSVRCITIEPESPSSVFPVLSIPFPVYTVLLYTYPELHSYSSSVLMPNLARFVLMNFFQPSQPFQSIRLSSTVSLLLG
jgi:hypothetical protein